MYDIIDIFQLRNIPPVYESLVFQIHTIAAIRISLDNHHIFECFEEGTQRITSEKGDYVLTYTTEFKPSPTQALRLLGCG